MFIDHAQIQVSSGAGGNGVVAWRREKFVSHGGPAGGDGGGGGSVYVEATDDLNTLLTFKKKSIFRAPDGGNGQSKNRHGRNGKDITIFVPCGTLIKDTETDLVIADLVDAGDRVMVAQGGRGGRGNARFTSSTRQAPQFCEPGEPGIERTLYLELKVIADVGIIGLPNAGKSTLISVISAVKPKIADYPFTTLTPNLGVVQQTDSDNAMIVADIPGLIEGASDGAGLGHDFLRHVERTRLLWHVVDIAGNETPEAAYDTVQTELKKYRDTLASKPQLLILSKTDAADEAEIRQLTAAFEEKLETPVFALSAVSRQGLEPLLQETFRQLEIIPKGEKIVPVAPDMKAIDHDDSAYEIQRVGKAYEVVGGRIERLLKVTDMRNRAAVHRLMNILNAMGVYEALEAAGIQDGDTVLIGDVSFEYAPRTPEPSPEQVSSP